MTHMATLIINYKAYKEGIDNGIEIAMEARRAAEKFGVEIIVAVPFTLCRGAAKITRTISQGIDPVDPGAFTGHVGWYEIMKSGCIGSLVNHAEKRMGIGEIGKAVEMCRKGGLLSFVCVKDLVEAGEVLKFSPTAVAYEPVPLIGSGRSVSGAEPGIVREFNEKVHGSGSSLALVGAGVSGPEDIRKGVELGSDGFLVASAVMKGDFRTKIGELAAALVGRDLP